MSLRGPKPGCWPRGHHTSLVTLCVARSQVGGSPELAPQPFLRAVLSQQTTVTRGIPHRAPRAANAGPLPAEQGESRPCKILYWGKNMPVVFHLHKEGQSLQTRTGKQVANKLDPWGLC